uniref:Crystallin lambda 1 n=1 Tax=Bos taurus TaxID=9913 RepID=A0AAA9SYW4_BOVIN
MASPGSSAPGGVAVVGSGLIGRSWAMLFASAGFRVKLFDIEPRQVTDALVSLRKEMKMLELSGYLKGELGAEEQLSLISGCSDLREAVEGALHVQECVPENLELKRKLFAQLDKIADDHVILSSSSSCLLPSKLFAGLAHVKQCLVAHPVNPPYYVPLVELVPHPETAPATVDRTYALMRRVGQSPVRLLREIDGFALNRLQYAVIAEAWRLVEMASPSSRWPPAWHLGIVVQPLISGAEVKMAACFSSSLSCEQRVPPKVAARWGNSSGLKGSPFSGHRESGAPGPDLLRGGRCGVSG